jgi:hypothetical protein
MAWAPDYITTAEAKAYLRIDDTVDDTQIAVAITAASRAIDNNCHPGGMRQFGKVDVAEERFYTARWRSDRCRWVVEVDDLMSQASLAAEIDGDSLTAYQFEPRNATVKGRPWTRLVIDRDSAVTPSRYDDSARGVAITALWGWTAVPGAVKQAALLQTSRLLARRDSPFGIAGTTADGSELRLLAKVDPDVAVTLRTYVRLSGVG